MGIKCFTIVHSFVALFYKGNVKSVAGWITWSLKNQSANTFIKFRQRQSNALYSQSCIPPCLLMRDYAGLRKRW